MTVERNAGRRSDPGRLRAFCVAAFEQAGLGRDEAVLSADVLVASDEGGVYSHGCAQLANYVRKIRAGGIRPGQQPGIVGEGPSWAILDAHAGNGMTASVFAMEMAIAKAEQGGISYVGVRNSNHFGAAGYYARMAAERGMLGLAMSNTDVCMTSPGGSTPVLGTNPLAYAVPGPKDVPVSLDIALSTTAASKIHRAKALGERIPEGWLVDRHGLPTTDTSEWPREGSQTAMAEHKGFGLAVLVEILSAVLTGASVGREVKGWVSHLDEAPGLGHAFVALDLGKMMPVKEFEVRMDRLRSSIVDAPRKQGTDRILMPGEPEVRAMEQSQAEGLLLPAAVIAVIDEVSREFHVDAEQLWRDE